MPILTLRRRTTAFVVCVLLLLAKSALAALDPGFDQFLTKFRLDPDFRLHAAPASIPFRRLNLDGAPEPVWERNFIRAEALQSLLGRKDWRVDFVDGKSAGALLSADGVDELRLSFAMRRGDWMLNRVDDLTVSAVRSPASTEPAAQVAARAASCLAAGRNLERKASASEHTPQALYDRAEYAYLCAARAGSNEAAWLAVRLSSSGQANPLSRLNIEALLKQAASTVPEAASELATRNCSSQPACSK